MKLTPTHESTLEDRMICEATEHFNAAEAAVRKGCQHALLAGLRLIWLHKHTANPVGSNQHNQGVSRETGFDGALKRIGINRPTAYRWMGATAMACERCTLIFDGLAIHDELPEPDSVSWGHWEKTLKEVAAGMSLRRLVLGSGSKNSDETRQELLIHRAEAPDLSADEVLAAIACGEMTLVQAMRAAAGALATKGKERHDPIYLDFDVETKRPVGLIPRAFVTLRNGFAGWETYTPAARSSLRAEWEETRLLMPDELFATSKTSRP